MNRIFAYLFSCTFLVTSFKNGTSRALRKKEHIDKKLWRWGADDPHVPLLRRPWERCQWRFPVSLLFTLNRFHTLLWNWHDNLFKIFKKLSDWLIFPNSYLHYIKYRNVILFPGDEILCKRSVFRDNSLHLILVSEVPARKFFSMAAFAKGCSNSCIKA